MSWPAFVAPRHTVSRPVVEMSGALLVTPLRFIRLFFTVGPGFVCIRHGRVGIVRVFKLDDHRWSFSAATLLLALFV